MEGQTADGDILCCISYDNATFRLIAGAFVPIGHQIAPQNIKYNC